MSILSSIEGDIVTRQATISYFQAANGGTVRGTTDVVTALNLSHIPAPATIVEYAGEDAVPGNAGPLHLGGGTDKAQHYMRTLWDLFLIAQNFGGRYDDTQTGRADDPDTGQKGVMTMVDDTFAKFAGYQLPSIVAKTFWGGAKRYTVADGVVIYVVRLYADIVRSN